jgi:hypothetical protein
MLMRGRGTPSRAVYRPFSACLLTSTRDGTHYFFMPKNPVPRLPLVERQIADQAKAHGLTSDEVVEKIMLEPAAIKRLIEPREVADYVLYLCTDAAGIITGSAQMLDLGWTAR